MDKNTRLAQKKRIPYLIRGLIAGVYLLILFCPLQSGSQESGPIDITGYWEAEETADSPFILFQFKMSPERLLGTVTTSGLGKSHIIDGSIQGDRVAFSTRHQVVKESARYNQKTRQWSRPTYKDIAFQYKGTISQEGIRFIRQADNGYFAEFLAVKVVDKTDQVSPTQTTFSLNYTLPGHEGGVNSLSFGPDDGRYGNGGLRLASGGTRDGLVKLWNLATGEFYGDRDMKKNMPPDDASVQVLYVPRVRDNKAVELQAGAVSSLGFLMFFSDMSFLPHGTSSGGQGLNLDGLIGIMSYSANGRRMALSERMDDGTTKLYIRHGGGGSAIHTLKTREHITALAFDPAAKFLAVAGNSAGKDYFLKLIEVKEGTKLWMIKVPAVLDTLVFQPGANSLVAGSETDPDIRLYQVDDGAQSQTIPDKQARGVSQLVFSQDGNLMAACGPGSNLITIWRVGDAFMLQEVVDNSEPVSVIALNHDGHLMVSGYKDSNTIRLYGKGKN